MKLSLCIATYNRSIYLGQTLDALISQLTSQVEIVVVDGASQDETPALMSGYVQRFPQISYFRESINSGVDHDFDKAVSYARGDYCWLMSDDDLISPGAISTVIAQLTQDPRVVIVNSEIRDKQLAMILKESQLQIDRDRIYEASDIECLFSDVGSYLSFIGAVVVQRTWWLCREREKYYGSLFIHMGVIFQQPLPERVIAISKPLIQIRYGNAMWTARSFEIWNFKWPNIVWSFSGLPIATKQRICQRYPATSLRTLLWYRALGAYGSYENTKFLSGENKINCHILGGVVSRLPVSAVNATLAIYCYFSRHRDARMKLYDLTRVESASLTACWLARRSQFPETGK